MAKLFFPFAEHKSAVRQDVCAERTNIKDERHETVFRFAAALAAVASLLAACTQPKLIEQTAQPDQPANRSPAAVPDQATVAEEPPAPKIARKADALHEQPLPPLKKGAIERFDCLSGTPNWHARIAFEAQGGQVLGFAYYSIWKPRTCSIEVMRNAAGSKWRMTPDGAVRVYTSQGQFLIRTRADAYVFEFEHVQREKFCGMPGEINGTMTIKRRSAKPQCSVVGVMDTNDPYLDVLYKGTRHPR